MTDDEDFDVVLVGAGPAGCVLARRLTEDSRLRVALVEAGPDYGPDPAVWPEELRDPSDIFPDSHSWGYLHAGRPADRPLSLPRARVVGGSSAINGCIWVRGSAADYDEWATLGNPGWGFADLLPYFKRSEADPLGGRLHGTDGPVPIVRFTPAEMSPLDLAFVAAAELLGFPWRLDLNGAPEQHPSVGPSPRNIAADVRMHAAFTYLAAARQRPNFSLIPDALVDRVGFANGRATGIRTADGRQIRGREVILCAGAYGSPAILLRSGVGPAADLRQWDIPVIVDSPGVGRHLLDHPTVSFFNGNDFTSYWVKPECAPDATSAVPTLIKARSSQVSDEVDLYVIHGQFLDEAAGRWVAWFLINLEVARSQGRVSLTSLDPMATLEIDHAYFSHPSDLEACCDGIELIEKLVSTSPLLDTIDPIPDKVPTWRDRDELRARLRAEVTTTFHPSSTCRMGPADDRTAVVDHAGRVYGVAGLRVADASIFPTSPRANIHCTVVAVAEKLADAIRADLTA